MTTFLSILYQILNIVLLVEDLQCVNLPLTSFQMYKIDGLVLHLNCLGDFHFKYTIINTPLLYSTNINPDLNINPNPNINSNPNI